MSSKPITGKMKIEVDYDENGKPVDLRLKGDASAAGQLFAASALITAASQQAGVTLRSGLYLMAKQMGWDWLEMAIMEAAEHDDE